MALPTNKRNVQNILGIFDLVHIIASFCDKPDWVRLASVCKAAFYATAPLVWRHVDGVHNFIGLLPGIGATKNRRGNRVALTISPDDMSALEMARLQLYTTSIRSIKIYNVLGSHYDVTDWELLTHTLGSKTLPPNLWSLDLTSSCSHCTQHQPLWVNIFACDSLTGVLSAPVSVDHDVEISSLHLNGVVELLAKRSPDLEKLSLFSFPSSHSSQESTINALDSLALHTPTFQSSLSILPELRDLDCNLNTLCDSLATIGCLPRLECLTVWPSFRASSTFTQDPLCSASFHRLTKLTSNLNDPDETESLLNMAPVLRQVTALKISIGMGACDVHEGSWVVDRMLPCLTNAPLLQDLHLDFGPGSDTTSTFHEAGYEALMDTTRLLPLRTVTLDHIQFLNTSNGPSPFSGVEAAWPQVTRLSMPHHTATAADLVHLSTLPSLRHLLLKLRSFDNFPAPKDLPDKSSGIMLQNLDGSMGSEVDGCEVDQLARYFFSHIPTGFF
ncbi:hypothetical protein FRC12_008147 [Ceratobasidium sp. 428]|nr:hypothetical protein FRC12_008147 [Ceratobasidium sp. 428]